MKKTSPYRIRLLNEGKDDKTDGKKTQYIHL